MAGRTMVSAPDVAKEQLVTTYNPRNIDYLGHLARESAMFGHALDGAASDARVPTCPDWDADDLLWHLGEVQWFWGTVVREGVDAEGAGAVAQPRPKTRAALMDFYLTASTDLGKALTSASPESHPWTWSDDKTLGFIIRRQAHEALIHRLDPELTAGQRRPLMDPQLTPATAARSFRTIAAGRRPA